MAHLKEEKYAEMAVALNATVVPAIIETYGAIGDHLTTLIKQIANYANNNPYGVWSAREIYHGLSLDISLILQNWNARILLHGKHRDDQRRWPVLPRRVFCSNGGVEINVGR